MKQHNHWKLNSLLRGTSKYVLWGFGLVLLVMSTYLEAKISFDLVSEIIGGISILLGLLLSFLEKTLWKTKIMRLPFLEEYWTPVLEGRWVGTLTRDGNAHSFVLEVRQSFTSVNCVTYSTHSASSAIASEIIYNEALEQYQLIYYWRGKTSSVQANTGTRNSFDGFTILDIIIEGGNVVKLKGEYFTNRQPTQTQGTLELQFQQKTLKNAFE